MTRRIRSGVLLCSLFAISSASAATRNWDGDTIATWATAGNWDTAPANSLLTDIANFNLATYGGNPVFAPTVGTATSINGLTIGASNGGMTLTHTAALSIGASGIIIANGAGAFTISGSTTLGASQSWANDSGNLFTFGAVANGTNLLTIGGSGNTTASGVIGNGAGGLTKEGAGLLTLNAANTYTGTTTVNGGELRWGINNAIATGALNINDGGTVNMNGFTDTVGTVTLNAGGTIMTGAGSLLLTTGAGGFITTGGTVDAWPGIGLGGNFAYNSAGGSETTANIRSIHMGNTRTFTIADGVQAIDVDVTSSIWQTTIQNYNITKAGAGTLRLSGTSGNYNLGSGTTTINDGILLLDKSASVNALGGTGTLTIGDGTGAAGTAVVRHATGSADDQIVNNAVTINSTDGLWDLNGHTETTSGALTIGRGGQVDLNGGTLSVGATVYDANSTAVSTTPIKNTVGGGSLTLTALTITPSGGYDTTFSLNGATLTLGGNVVFNASPADTTGRSQITGGMLTLNGNRTFNVGVGTGATYDLDINVPITETGGARTLQQITSDGRLQFSGSTANTYSGLTTVSGGRLLLSKTGSVNAIANGGLTIGSGNNTICRVQYTGGSSDMMGTGTFTINGRSRFDFNGHTDTIGNVVIANSGATSDANSIINTAGTGNLTIGTLGITPVAGLTTVINAGTSGTITLGGTLTFTAATTGQAQITGQTLSLGGNRTFTVARGTGATFDLDITSAITGTGNTLTAGGAGFIRFSGSTANTYDGLTTISAGSLLLDKSGSANAIAGGGLTVGSAGTTAATVQYTGSSIDMMGAGTVTLLGRGILDFNGKTDTIGNLIITATSAGASTTPLINTAGSGSLTIGTLTITPAAGYTSQVNSGTGTLNMGGDLTFTAATTGQAQISGNLDLGGATRTFTIGLGTGANQDVLVDAVISGTSVGLTKAGTGRLALTGVNTYTGATTVNAGTLLVNSPGSLASGSAITVATGATLGGNGTINGTLTASSGANLAPGAGASTIGKLALANTLTLNGANLYFDVTSAAGAGTTYDQIDNLTSNLVVNGVNVVYLNIPSGAAAGTYDLITCSSKSGIGSVVFANGLTNWGNATLTVDNAGVHLTITSDIAIDLWKGNLSGVWDGGILNWTKNGSADQPFTDGDVVTFDDTATTKIVSSGGTVSPYSVTFNNTIAYTNLATIGGVGSLTKMGSGTLTISGTNSFSGGVFINGGTLELPSGATSANLGDSGNIVTYTGDATIKFNSNTTLSQGFVINTNVTGTFRAYKMTITINNALAGSGTLYAHGEGDGGGGVFVFTSTNNTFSGDITIRGQSASYLGTVTT